MGPQGTEFEGGYYHGRIILPTEYPMKPPSIIMLTVSHFSLSQSKLSFLSRAVVRCFCNPLLQERIRTGG